MSEVFVLWRKSGNVKAYLMADGGNIVAHWHTFDAAKAARDTLPKYRSLDTCIGVMDHDVTGCPGAIAENILDLANAWNAELTYDDVNIDDLTVDPRMGKCPNMGTYKEVKAVIKLADLNANRANKRSS